SPLARAFAKSLFGGLIVDRTGAHDPQRRTFWDEKAETVEVPGLSPFNSPSGRTVANLPTADDGFVFGLPAQGARILALMPKPHLSSGDEYSFYRQATREEGAAEFVPKRGDKPESAFGYEKVKDRV